MKQAKGGNRGKAPKQLLDHTRQLSVIADVLGENSWGFRWTCRREITSNMSNARAKRTRGKANGDNGKERKGPQYKKLLIDYTCQKCQLRRLLWHLSDAQAVRFLCSSHCAAGGSSSCYYRFENSITYQSIHNMSWRASDHFIFILHSTACKFRPTRTIEACLASHLHQLSQRNDKPTFSNKQFAVSLLILGTNDGECMHCLHSIFTCLCFWIYISCAHLVHS